MARTVQPSRRSVAKPQGAGAAARPARGVPTDGVLALQRMAGNAAVGQLIARQPADVKSSRRAIVLWEGKERGKRVKFKSKLVVRGQIPAGNSTLDKIVGATEAENVSKKASALETEFIALDGDIWKLTPDGFQKRMKELGVKATIEFEPFDAAVKTADSQEFALPSIDLMKFNAKLEWAVAGMVFELELSASLSPTILLGAADRKVLEQFEKKAKEIGNASKELKAEESKLNKARDETRRAQTAADDAAKRSTKDIPERMDHKLDKTRKELESVRERRKAADAAVDAARKRRDDAFNRLKNQKLPWDEYKKQSQELLDKSAKEIRGLSKKAGELAQFEGNLSRGVETHARRVKSAEFDRANKALRKAKAAEEKLERGIKQRVGRIKQLGKEAVDIAKKGKSWVFKKIVGPRMIRVLGFLAKAIPILNIISLAADLYEIGKLLWNWDKIKFGIGGGDGGAGGSGSGGKADPSGKGSGTGAPGATKAPGQGGPGGPDPWDPGTPVPPAPAPGPDTPAPGTTKPDPQGTSKTGTGTKPTGTGSGAPPPQGPGVDPTPPGSPPGQGNDPTGTQDVPGGAGKPGGGTTGTDTTGTGTTGGGQGGGGKLPPKKPGKQPDTPKPGGGKPGPGKPVGGKGGKGDDERADKPKQKPKAVAIKYVRAVAIAQAAADDIDVFALGSTPQIAKFGGINKWTAGKNGSATTDVVSLTVKHDGQVYRVSGVPIRVTARTEDIPPNTPDRDEYSITLRMEVTKTLKLQGTKLVINPGDELHYTWEGSY